MPSSLRPLLRYVEPQSHVHDGQRFILLTDPQGFAERVYPITLYGAYLLQMFDGRHTVEQMREEFRRATGHDVPAEDVEGLIRELDGAGYLESPAFEERRRRVVRDFTEAPTRPASHTGAYTAEASELPGFLSKFWKDPRGPGKAPPRSVKPGKIRGILAPHIDFHRGGACYAHAYGALASACSADTFVILGTAHQSPRSLYTATKKAYETPLGPAPVDGEFVDELAKRYGRDLFADEYFHRTEHSIEFQAVCLKWLFGDRPFRIVPVLVSSMHGHVAKKSDPLADPEIRDFVDALRQTVDGRSVCFIGAVDLAHVGAKFGDREPVTEDLLKKIEEEDLASLEKAAAVDAPGFFRSIAQGGDWRKICGLSPITTMLAAMDASRGKLVKYDRFADLENHEVVSYTAMEFR
ncbi:MAG: AmmeMemoRadiSam system protein B [Planctomycetes bacterium]|nr:AmmeMemoRadiSam system protein B [Planctomycetota bacterium]